MKKRIVIFIIPLFLIISIVLYYLLCSSPEKRNFDPDVYKKYAVVDKHLAYLKAGDVFGTIYRKHIYTGGSVDLPVDFRKIENVPVNEFVAVKKWPLPFTFGSSEYCIYRNPDCNINPIKDLTISSIQIYDKYDSIETGEENIGEKRILFTNTDKSLLSDIKESAQRLTETIPKDQIIRGMHSYYIRLTFSEYSSIVWDAEVYKCDNNYAIESILYDDKDFDSDGNRIYIEPSYSRLSDDLCRYIDGLNLNFERN